MRKIKFRAQSDGSWIKRGEWLYGDLIHGEHKPYIYSDDSGEFSKISVILETAGQYTGMNDCNNVDIYEGDIVRTSDNDDELATVDFDAENFKVVVTHGNVCTNLGEYYPHEVEVVGNIYDNPELING